MTNNSAPTPPEQIARINRQIREAFERAQHVLLISHIRPDGDAIGSLLGLGLALEQAGKTVRMLLADGLPSSFRHLEGSARVQRSAGDLSQYDCITVLDCSDLGRTGNGNGNGGGAANGGILHGRVPDLNIDHHITNLNFGQVNLVIPTQVATAAIVAEYLPEWGLRYNRSIAEALLTGIITDTIGFRTSNMNSEALRLAAMLMDLGASLPELYLRALVSKSYEATRYWAQGLNKIQRDAGAEAYGGLVYTTLSLTDRQAAQYNGNDDADLINQLAAIDDTDVAVIFVEQKNSHVKVSWRARPGIDVAQIALQFGGGGHAAAAGADISGSLGSVQKQVLDATRAMLAKQQPAKAANNGGPGRS